MPLLKSPQPETEKAKTEEQGELSAAEDFSDIGESDEEILNQDNDEEMPEAETEEANNEHETVISEYDSKHLGYLHTVWTSNVVPAEIVRRPPEDPPRGVSGGVSGFFG